jgi:hypothetical protein
MTAPEPKGKTTEVSLLEVHGGNMDEPKVEVMVIKRGRPSSETGSDMYYKIQKKR